MASKHQKTTHTDWNVGSLYTGSTLGKFFSQVYAGLSLLADFFCIFPHRRACSQARMLIALLKMSACFREKKCAS